jgi:hypothetical protein
MRDCLEHALASYQRQRPLIIMHDVLLEVRTVGVVLGQVDLVELPLASRNDVLFQHFLVS